MSCLGGLVSLTYTYDPRNLVSAMTGAGGVTSFTYDPGRRLTEIATPDGSSTVAPWPTHASYASCGNVTHVSRFPAGCLRGA